MKWEKEKAQSNGSCVYHLLHLGFGQGYNLYMQVPSRPYVPSGLSSCNNLWTNSSLMLTFGIDQSQTNIFLARKSQAQVPAFSLNLGVGRTECLGLSVALDLVVLLENCFSNSFTLSVPQFSPL